MFAQSHSNNIREIIFIVILISLLFICPLLSLVLSILFYRSKVSYPLFIFFAFYFGWFYYLPWETSNDLMSHYLHFKPLIGKSLLEIWNDPATIFTGKEPYPVIFKYITLSIISPEYNCFSACACATYAALFCGVLSSIRDLYTRKMDWLQGIAFLGISCTIEFYWFLGLRYYSGALVFTLFYIRYVRTAKKKYLFLSFLCILFHFAHIVLCVAILINELLKDKFKIRYVILSFSFLFRIFPSLSLKLISKFISLFQIIGKGSESINNVILSTQHKLKLASFNPIYFYKTDILFIGCFLVFLLLYIKDKEIIKHNSKLWGMILTLFSLLNLGFCSRIFYERLYRVSVFLFFIYMFIYLMTSDFYKNSEKKIVPILILGTVVFFAFLTPLVQHREFLLDLSLWFNNWL